MNKRTEYKNLGNNIGNMVRANYSHAAYGQRREDLVKQKLTASW